MSNGSLPVYGGLASSNIIVIIVGTKHCWGVLHFVIESRDAFLVHLVLCFEACISQTCECSSNAFLTWLLVSLVEMTQRIDLGPMSKELATFSSNECKEKMQNVSLLVMESF